jgi:hypothetical protein
MAKVASAVPAPIPMPPKTPTMGPPITPQSKVKRLNAGKARATSPMP